MAREAGEPTEKAGMADQQAARAQLEQLLAELDRSASTLQGAGGPDDANELPALDTSDAATNIVDNDREEASIEVIEAQRARVRRALERIDAGSYGRCVDCDHELPAERLEARPEAERCVDCQQRVEWRR